MTIGGETAGTESSFGVHNPATGAVFAEAPECTRQQLNAAFEVAAKAGRDWKADEPQRRAVLRRAGQVLIAFAADLVPVLTAEQGKPLADSEFEVSTAAAWCEYFAHLELPQQVI
jgi:acyl-CoA reductase-like NAD-dependent aldehyde dehydrogenase